MFGQDTHTCLTKRYQTFFSQGHSRQSPKYLRSFTADIKNGMSFKCTAIYIFTLRYTGLYIIRLYLQASEITNISRTLDWYSVSRKPSEPYNEGGNSANSDIFTCIRTDK
jgi:hypothetical protein